LKNSFSAKKISCDKGCLRGRCLSSGPEVYFVLAVDTEAYIEDSTLNDYSRRYDFSNYDGPSSITGSLFDSDLRFNKLDSYGDPFKLTWYLYTSENLCEGINTDCTSIYSSLTENWKNELDFYEDDLEWHFHNEEWNAPYSCWTQALFFDEGRREVAERILNSFLIDKNFFPSSYRAGWVWENNDFSNFLENTVFSDYSNLAPFNSTSGLAECQGNLYNWSGAFDNWDWYHPDSEDYQSPGNQNRFMFRCVPYRTFSAEEVMHKVREVNDGLVVCLYSHNTHPSTVYTLERRLDYIRGVLNYNNIDFSYVTAQEATRIILNSKDIDKPEISLDYESGIMNIQINEEIYGIPYAAIKSNNEYDRLEVENFGDSWFVEIPEDFRNEFIFAVAVTDLSGNVAIKKYVFPERVLENSEKLTISSLAN